MEEFARKLRRNSTDAELKLWYFLRNRNLVGYKFRRQHPLPPYVVDFVCIEAKLIVELDGGQHLERIPHDEKRTAFLKSKGYCVIRFWNDDALLKTEVVLEEILRILSTPHLQGAHSDASERRSVGAGRAPRIPHFTPNPLPGNGEREQNRSPIKLNQTTK